MAVRTLLDNRYLPEHNTVTVISSQSGILLSQCEFVHLTRKGSGRTFTAISQWNRALVSAVQ